MDTVALLGILLANPTAEDLPLSTKSNIKFIAMILREHDFDVLDESQLQVLHSHTHAHTLSSSSEIYM